MKKPTFINNLRKSIIQKLMRPEDGYIASGYSEGQPLKLYYQASTGKYLIGKRSDSWYYFEFLINGLSSYASRYLPWGQTVEKCIYNPMTKEMEAHTYGSEPYEVNLKTWLNGIQEDIYEQYIDRIMELTPEKLEGLQRYYERRRKLKEEQKRKDI